MLIGKTFVIYGAAGAVGRTVAASAVVEGADLVLTGRDPDTLAGVARELSHDGHRVETAVLDAADGEAVQAHLDELATRGRPVDISLNAVSLLSLPAAQGTPLRDMAVDDIVRPVQAALHTYAVTALAAGRHMAAQGDGVIILPAACAVRLSLRDRRHHTGGLAAANAALETFVTELGAELGPLGVRVVGIRSAATLETWPAEDHNSEAANSEALRATSSYPADSTALGRLPTLAEFADAVVFLASDRAASITATTLNATCGLVTD